jgi:multimeric flavodoxin WrbA
MAGTGHVLGLVGSPNRDGRTNRLVSAALAGAAEAGAATELVQMADHLVDACKDCLPWVCHQNGRCTYDDPGFAYLSGKILNCGALVLGTPVYWWDTSALVRLLILKMFRVHGFSAPAHGLPALGIAIAGGGGNGLISGLRPIYHFFQTMQMRALEPLPANRFNFERAVERARDLGAVLASMSHQRHPFARADERFLPPDTPAYVGGLEERLLWYDSLPYLGLDRMGERRLVAGLAVSALGAAGGDDLAAMRELTRVYESALKVLGRH